MELLAARTPLACCVATRRAYYAVLADDKIHIMGSFSNIKLARDAISSLILGSPPGKVRPLVPHRITCSMQHAPRSMHRAACNIRTCPRRRSGFPCGGWPCGRKRYCLTVRTLLRSALPCLPSGGTRHSPQRCSCSRVVHACVVL